MPFLANIKRYPKFLEYALIRIEIFVIRFCRSYLFKKKSWKIIFFLNIFHFKFLLAVSFFWIILNICQVIVVQKSNAINKKSCFSFFVGSSYIDLFSSSAMITQFTPMCYRKHWFFDLPRPHSTIQFSLENCRIGKAYARIDF